MTCISRRPACDAGSGDSIPEPIAELGSIVGIIATIGGTIGGVIKGLEGVIGVIGAIGAGGMGALSATAAAIAVIIVVGMYALDRCKSAKGLRECVAGVVHSVVQDFSDAIEEVFPFTAMHDRVDVVVKSRYWDTVEHGGAKVFCTDELPPRRSEILRCYFRTPRVCDAAAGAIIGTTVGAVGGIILGAVVAAAIGCATIILCIVALLVAAIVAAVAALVGAFAGGQIAKAASDSSSPTAAGGTTITSGDLINVTGNMVRRDFDEGANVLWFVQTSSLSGRAPATMPSEPFSYCELDDVFTMDTCPRAEG